VRLISRSLPLFLLLCLACGDDSGADGSTRDSGTTPAGDSGTYVPTPVPVTTVGELGLTPFDVNRQDTVGPHQHAAMYGKSPEIIVVASGTGFDVLLQDHAEALGKAWLLRFERDGDDYVIVRALEAPILDRIMGLARDEDGNLYVASGIAESDDLTVDYPAEDEYRSGIVRVVKLDAEGAVAFDTDLDLARESAADGPEQLINPMVASTARLAVGGGRVALVHGINTSPDDGGVRHQKAITTHLDVATGEVVRASSVWVSHSFDQRLFHDGNGFMEMHLGDAYPRTIVTARIDDESSGGYSLFHIKGETGANNTRTRLGDFAMIEGDPTFGYLALFATERTEDTAPMGAHDRIAGVRDLAIVRYRRDFESTERDSAELLDSTMPDSMTVTSGGGERSNTLHWITDHDAEESTTHAERPKLVALGGDRYLVLYERWSLDAGDYGFDGTWAMRIDHAGDVQQGPERVSDSHLPRGDDAFALEDGGAWLTGDSESGQLTLHLVTADLDTRAVIIE